MSAGIDKRNIESYICRDGKYKRKREHAADPPERGGRSEKYSRQTRSEGKDNNAVGAEKLCFRASEEPDSPYEITHRSKTTGGKFLTTGAQAETETIDNKMRNNIYFIKQTALQFPLPYSV